MITKFIQVNKKWSQPMQLNLGVPTPRAAHGMCAVGKDLVIFGGRDTECRRNDLHIYDTGNFYMATKIGKGSGEHVEMFVKLLL